jgi:hypothetical protein
MCDIVWCFVPSFFLVKPKHIFTDQPTQKAPFTIQNLGETSEPPIYRCKKHTQPVSFPLHSHSFPIQCWLYQLYLYFSSLKHIKPHFWGVGSTLKHSSFSKKHGQFHSIHTLEPVIFLSHFIFSIELNAFPIRFSTKFTKTWTSAGRSAGASAYAPSSPDSVAAAEQPPGRLSHGLHKSRGGGVTMRMWWEKTWEYDTRWCPSSFAKLVYKSNN